MMYITAVASFAYFIGMILKHAYSQRFKPVTCEARYQLGLLHEHRAETVSLQVIEGATHGPIAPPELKWADAMLRLVEGHTLGPTAPPELQWVEAMRTADACFRDARREGFPGAAANHGKCDLSISATKYVSRVWFRASAAD